jgi:hypothetical protein
MYQMLVINNFNLSLDNLGTDTESLEETCLARIHTGWAGWDNDINWGNCTSLSVSTNLCLRSGLKYRMTKPKPDD